MSSKKEQAALIAFFNSFSLSKRITSFDQLNDGKALMEASTGIPCVILILISGDEQDVGDVKISIDLSDANHFKITSTRATPPGENWVLKMNTMCEIAHAESWTHL